MSHLVYPRDFQFEKIISHCVGRELPEGYGSREQGGKEKYHLNKLSNLFSGSPQTKMNTIQRHPKR
jgi:hypothetical protein